MKPSTRLSICLLASTLSLLSSALPAGSQSATAAVSNPAVPDRDGAHDFDFLVGKWKMHNHRLRNPLTGSHTWVDFEGESVARMIWDGQVSQDETVFHDPSGRIDGMTLRFYNAKSHQWSIYWTTKELGYLPMPPVVGRFDKLNGRGEFYDQETWHGSVILVRFVWTVVNKDALTWEQAFSDDGGKSWEVNWSQTIEREK